MSQLKKFLLAIIFSGPILASAIEDPVTNIDHTKLRMNLIVTTLGHYSIICKSYPTTLDGLEALKNPVLGKKLCKDWGPEPYLDGIPIDVWGRPFIYESDGKTFRLVSLGADRREGGSGKNSDIVITSKVFKKPK